MDYRTLTVRQVYRPKLQAPRLAQPSMSAIEADVVNRFVGVTKIVTSSALAVRMCVRDACDF